MVDTFGLDELFFIVSVCFDDEDLVLVLVINEAVGGIFSIEVVSFVQFWSFFFRSFFSFIDEFNFSGEMVINGKGIEIQVSDDLIVIQEIINEVDVGVFVQILMVDLGDSRLIFIVNEVGKEGFDFRDVSVINFVQVFRFISSEMFVKNSFISGVCFFRFLDDD